MQISFKFAPMGAINNAKASVQTMAWHWPGDKLCSELMLIRSLTHIWVTQLKWVLVINILVRYEQVMTTIRISSDVIRAAIMKFPMYNIWVV